MKKIFVIFLFLAVLPAFSAEEDNLNPDILSPDEVQAEQNEEFKFSPGVSSKVRKRAYVRPKREQLKTKAGAEASLKKNKDVFNKRKENELRLLRDEKELLEYAP